MTSDITLINRAAVCQMRQQAVEKGDITIRFDAQMQIGKFTCGGSARINIDNAQAGTRFFRSSNPLVQHRMAPREV